MKEIYSESIFIPIASETDPEAKLHLRHFYSDKKGAPVFMLHGAIENGRIFYTDSGKGFAPFLARNGFDVYVADLRGRGLSTPLISEKSTYGQTEGILEDIPNFVNEIFSRTGKAPQWWVAHSWGGVLLLAALARIPHLREKVCALIYFGTKRSVRVQNWEKWLKIDFFWKGVAPLLVKMYGFLPAREWKIGADNETIESLRQSRAWVKPGPWIDPKDGFDYGKALQKFDIPPALYLAGDQDRCLGHPDDVKDLIREAGSQLAEFRMLPGYGHIDMLTAPKAVEDHFVGVLKWMKEKGAGDE